MNYLKPLKDQPMTENIDLSYEKKNPSLLVYISDSVKHLLSTIPVFKYDKNNQYYAGFDYKEAPWVELFLNLVFEKRGELCDIINSFPNHHHTPYLTLFMETMSLLPEIIEKLRPIYKDTKTTPIEKKMLTIEEFIETLKNLAQTKEFKESVQIYKSPVAKNYKSELDYIDYLFKKHARLLVLRVDLSYKKSEASFMSPMEIDSKHNEAIEDRKHLFNNIPKNGLFEHMVGYIWKLEYSSRKEFHYHMTFFYDGSKVREDLNIAMRIGEYWKNVITKGRGIYHNCNAKKEEYAKCGIGMINYYDDRLRENLCNEVVNYLVKPDLYANINTRGNRSFSRGTIDSDFIISNRGRPRKY